MLSKLEFYLLDDIIDDYYFLWEILSFMEGFRPELNESDRIEATFDILNSLLVKGYIEVYKGVYFNGDEEIIPDFKITTDFILNHKDDWKIKEFGKINYRFSVTDKGDKAYMKGFQENR